MTVIPLTTAIPVDFYEGMDYEYAQSEMHRLKRIIEMAMARAKTRKEKARLSAFLHDLERAIALPPV